MAAPTDITLSASTIAENSANNSVVGILGTVDPDSASWTYTLTDNAGGRFKVVNNAGTWEIQVNNGTLLDFEAASTHTITVQTNDGTGTFSKSFTITLTDVAGQNLTGTSSGETLTGGIESDSLSGLGGNDSLDGGAAADTMAGGDGNDTYAVDNASDIVTENSDAGTDVVRSSLATYTLAANVEEGVITKTDGASIFGNALDNTLTGNAGADALDGGAGNDYLDGGADRDTMSGGNGNDTYVVNHADDLVVEGSGSTSGTDLVNSSISYTLTTFVENLTLSGSTDINATGNTGDNSLTGNTGNNSIDGGVGADSMVGGAGNDSYKVDNLGDTVTESAGQGTDIVTSSVSFTLGANIENLVLTGVLQIEGVGNSGNNSITGGSGRNLIDGGAGADSMAGAGGDDTYVVDSASDVVTEELNAGTDLVRITASMGATYTLGANVEHATITFTGAQNIEGNALNNSITGGDGANAINGGAGSDSMVGGDGNDSYTVDASGDRVTELEDEGTDLVSSSVSFTLGDHLENLTLTGSGNVNGVGNALANVIEGNSGNNRLDGLAGGDSYVGSAGDDTYVFGTGDSFSTNENADTSVGGIDTIETDATFSLATVTGIERLTLTGTGDINATGSTADNTLTGNTGANILDGGTGADSMVGGHGNDTYVVDNLGDKVSETTTGATGGTDLVQSSVSFTLGNNVENITLTAGGQTATGNSLDNSMTGSSGDDVLDGKIGADTMTGGDGSDTYYVDSTSDVVSADSAGAADTVVSTVSFTLGSGIENLVLSGALAATGVGNAGGNSMTGSNAGNLLDGDAGNDTMAGGLGNDTYIVDSATDSVIEDASAGTDEVQIEGTTIASWTLADNFERLTLLSGATASITGNTGANTLTGNDGANLIDGASGNDSMAGGDGNDTYVVDSSSDIVSEGVGKGTDLVRTSVSYTLGANLESLTLLDGNTINGTGNADANTITGNSSANFIDGGAGNDSMSGGDGDDTFVVDSSSDVASGGNGTDEVRGGLNINLTSYTSIENAMLTGTDDFNLTGLDGSANRLEGNAGANLIDGGTGADTMLGGTGNDTYTVDNAGDVVSETAIVGGGIDLVRSSVAFTLGTNVEMLELTSTTGTALGGNQYANTITGNNGNDTIDGGLGNDSMVGGAGDDSYVVDNAGDKIQEGVGAGTDTVRSTGGNYTLSANIENLILAAGAANGFGNAGNNDIQGNNGHNRLGGAAGADTLTGFGGNDTYVVDSASDSVVEASSAGIDKVESWLTSAAYTLADNVENLQLMGTAAINGAGNALANNITGNAAANAIDGGAGKDTMAGGAGNDTYTVDDSADRVSELAGQGVDTVLSSVTYSIFGQSIEILTLTGGGDVNATGSADANTITGNSGDNILDGKGGADSMVGGDGDDVYIVERAGDIVSEAATVGAGTADHIKTSVSYTLSANVELMTLTGASSINGTGNDLANTITGNAGANRIDGGLGADTMVGGGGNDTYIVNASGETVTELSGQGIDLVESSVSFTLGANIENLLLNTAGTTGAGNGLANLMRGGTGAQNLSGDAGADTLDGGVGNDTLTGGAGSDVFRFTSALNGTTNVDQIVDYNVADDTIRLDKLIFTALSTTGTLAASAFVIGAAATTADHRIIVNGADIFYDADGTGAGAAVKFATMNSAIAGTLTNADFVIF